MDNIKASKQTGQPSIQEVVEAVMQEMHQLHQEQWALAHRVAKIEAVFEGFFQRELEERLGRRGQCGVDTQQVAESSLSKLARARRS